MSEMLQFPAGRASPIAVAGSILTCAGHDNTIRWRPGERLQHLFERRVATLSAAGHADHTALEVDGALLSFEALDRAANRMARYLRSRGLGAGDRIGLIVDRSIAAYVSLLAVLKIEAAYVPLDTKFPSERIAFIAGDAGIKAFLVTKPAERLVEGLGLTVIEIEAARIASAAFDDDRIDVAGIGQAADRLCYIIYTSGSTGWPKGVAVNHSSICNFVQVATEVYGYRPGDRVYQGITLAFDFSVEELWVPLMSGATLVPSPADRQLVGEELAQFLIERRVTAMCCVPTLLATIDRDVPELRLLLVSGEACPQDIVMRWHRPGRRMLNAYGPTEATVTATWTEVHPDKPVTIGVPLPTYTVAILETGRDALAREGDVGEVAIAGIGLAEGYVNRDDLTAKAFVPDFLQLAGNPSRRLYRTGDLGRINDDGEVEYLGRIDAQVKIRGYRIELGEIENVLIETEGVAQAVVVPFEAEPGVVELAAYVTRFKDGERPSREYLLQVLRSRLPGYMVPAYIEEIDVMPLLASHKADRKALPPPSGLRLVSRSRAFVEPRTELEGVLAECLAETMRLDQVSVDDHFFEDLGAHSLLMGQFLAAVNTRLPHAKAAISDVYLAPSVALLARDLDERASAVIGKETAGRVIEPHIASDWDYLRCGILQGLFYVAQYALWVWLSVVGLTWVSEAAGAAEAIARAAAYGGGVLAFTLALPIAAKWGFIGRWKAETIPIWSLAYVRFWIVQRLIEGSPWRLLQGTVLFNVFLRLLGARIGHGALILTRNVPLVTDLLYVGERSVLRRDSYLAGYRAVAGRIETGPVDIGADVLVGESSLIDLETSIGDGAQLGHASALLKGQHIPAGRHYHGSPARETKTDFRGFSDAAVGWWRRAGFAAARLVSVYAATIATFVIMGGVLSEGLGWRSSDAAVLAASSGITLAGIANVIGWSAVIFTGGYLLLFALHLCVPRLLRLLIVPGKIYPLYGFHHIVAGLLARFGCVPSFQMLFGDSSGIVHYLRWLGVRQPNVQQTGSNFGSTMVYESPFEIEFGRGTMISDGLAITNIETGSGRFRVVGARIGPGSFVGNVVAYPAHARTGDNCLLATKVMVPVDGDIRENTGLLGSPAFAIPRTTVNGKRFDPVPSTDEDRARLRAKNRFNFRTALMHLTAQWSIIAGIMVIGYLCSGIASGWWLVVLMAALTPVYVLSQSIVVERLSTSGIEMRPHNCTIHEPYFWWIERYWKLSDTIVRQIFKGTPFRLVLLRLQGLEIGAKVFEEGASIPEKRLVRIGDNCCLNAQSSLQSHSLEDGLFKSDRISIGDGCTIGPGGFVHYGVHMGDGAVLSPDAFLMKGAAPEAGSYWEGNPARPL